MRLQLPYLGCAGDEPPWRRYLPMPRRRLGDTRDKLLYVTGLMGFSECQRCESSTALSVRMVCGSCLERVVGDIPSGARLAEIWWFGGEFPSRPEINRTLNSMGLRDVKVTVFPSARTFVPSQLIPVESGGLRLILDVPELSKLCFQGCR